MARRPAAYISREAAAQRTAGMNRKSILISGGGIAGLTLAIQLK